MSRAFAIVVAVVGLCFLAAPGGDPSAADQPDSWVGESVLHTKPVKDIQFGDPMHLYDLMADPGETRDVQADHADLVKELTTLMEKYITQGRSTAGKPQKNGVSVPLWLPAPKPGKK